VATLEAGGQKPSNDFINGDFQNDLTMKKNNLRKSASFSLLQNAKLTILSQHPDTLRKNITANLRCRG
jgi:hypothetical protein